MLATGLPATALTGVDSHHLGLNRRFLPTHLGFPLLRALPSAMKTALLTFIARPGLLVIDQKPVKPEQRARFEDHRQLRYAAYANEKGGDPQYDTVKGCQVGSTSA